MGARRVQGAAFVFVLVLALIPLGAPTAVAGPPADYVVETVDPGGLSMVIDDNDRTTFSLEVENVGTVVDVDPSVRISHERVGDLRLTLRHRGVSSSLTTQQGGDGDNFGTGAMNCGGSLTTFSDEATTSITSGSPPYAGTFKPVDTNFATRFDSVRSDGTWHLQMDDLVSGTEGVLHCFKLRVIIDLDSDDDLFTDEEELEMGSNRFNPNSPIVHERTAPFRLRNHLVIKGTVKADPPSKACTQDVKVHLGAFDPPTVTEGLGTVRTNVRSKFRKSVEDEERLYRPTLQPTVYKKKGKVHLCTGVFPAYKEHSHT